jgi:dihydrofolate reductase
MGKIVMSGPQNVSLDGVVQDPDGQEGFGLGGWFVEFGGTDLEEWNKLALEDALRAEAWLLGRRSYEFFGMRWRPRSGELADRLNSMPKYVVSSTLEDPEWNNSIVLKGDVVSEISRLKQALEGDIVVPASYQLGRSLGRRTAAGRLPRRARGRRAPLRRDRRQESHAPRRQQDRR